MLQGMKLKVEPEQITEKEKIYREKDHYGIYLF